MPVSRSDPKLEVTPMWVGGLVVVVGGCASVWTRSSSADSLVVEMNGNQGVCPITSNGSSGNRRFRARTTEHQGELGWWAGVEFSIAESKCATSD